MCEFLAGVEVFVSFSQLLEGNHFVHEFLQDEIELTGHDVNTHHIVLVQCSQEYGRRGRQNKCWCRPNWRTSRT